MPKLRPLTIEIIFKDMSYKHSGLTLKRAGEVINEKIKDIFEYITHTFVIYYLLIITSWNFLMRFQRVTRKGILKSCPSIIISLPKDWKNLWLK